MTDTLTPTQTLLMWGLLAKHGCAAQEDIEPAVKAADRATLERKKLISSQKVSRKLYLSVLDVGWAWASKHLQDELPPNCGALRDLLSRLDEYLKGSRKTLGDFIGVAAETPLAKALRLEAEKKAAETKAKAAAKAAKARAAAEKKALATKKTSKTKDKNTPAVTKRTATKTAETVPRTARTGSKSGASRSAAKPSPTSSTPADVRQAIEQAYLAVTKNRKGVDAKLAAVRAHLPHIDRARVDAALTSIVRNDDKARLMRMDAYKSITPADAEAALNYAGETFHILWIFE